MRFHVQHDDEVWCEDLALIIADSEADAHKFVARANKAFEKIERLRPSMIPMPKNADEAEAMERLGFAWLKANAPHRLTEAGLARPSDLEEK